MNKKFKFISKLLGAFSLIACFGFGLFLLLDHRQKQNTEVCASQLVYTYNELQPVVNPYNITGIGNSTGIFSGKLLLSSGYDYDPSISLSTKNALFIQVTAIIDSFRASSWSSTLNITDVNLSVHLLYQTSDDVAYTNIYLTFEKPTNSNELTIILACYSYDSNEQFVGSYTSYEVSSVVNDLDSALYPSFSINQVSQTPYKFIPSFVDVASDAYSQGYDDGYAGGYNNGYNSGYESGYNVGFDDGVASQAQVITDSYNKGYADGYNIGFSTDSTATTIFSGILQVALVPINFFLAIFNFEILGINLSAFIKALFTIAITIIVVKAVLGGKGASE